MADRKLEVISGSAPRRPSGKTAQVREAMAKRWRMEGPVEQAPRTETPARDVIPLLDGWIRRLEKETSGDDARPR